MNIQSVAADIARRVPDMAKDTPLNNASVIAGMLCDFDEHQHTNELVTYIRSLEEKNRHLRALLAYIAYFRLPLGDTVWDRLDPVRQKEIFDITQTPFH